MFSQENLLDENAPFSFFSSIIHGNVKRDMDSNVYKEFLHRKVIDSLKPIILKIGSSMDNKSYTFSIDDTMSRLTCSNSDGSLSVYSLDKYNKVEFSNKNKRVVNLDLLYSLNGHQSIATYHKFSSNNPEISYTGSLDKSIRIWNRDRRIKKIEVKDWVRALAISQNEQFFFIGTIDSSISIYDLNKEKMIISFNNIDSNNPKDTFAKDQAKIPTWLNSVNYIGLEKTNDENLFLASFRDGRVKLYDKRTLPMSIENNRQYEVFSLIAHGTKEDVAKVNTCDFLNDNLHIITSGRDSTVRLFDIRKINNGAHYSDVVIREWNKHICKNYLLNTTIMYDEYILTGSEDGNIYIYDLHDPEYCKVLKYHSSPVHQFQTHGGVILSCDIDSSEIVLWEPDLLGETSDNYEIPVPNKSSLWEEWLFERVMEHYGEEIMSKFHALSQKSTSTPSEIIIRLSKKFLRNLVEESNKCENFSREVKKQFQELYDDSPEEGLPLQLPANIVLDNSYPNDEDMD